MGNNTAIGGGGFHHIAIRSADFEASVRFYTEVLGFREKIRWGEGDGRGILLDTGDGNYVEIFAGRKTPPSEDGAVLHVAFRSSDVDAAIERARAAGAPITVEPKDVTIESGTGPVPIRVGFCKGPDGEIVEFFASSAL